MSQANEQFGRYAAFAYSMFYPNGGWKDMIGLHFTLEAASAAVTARCTEEVCGQGHVVDLTTATVVWTLPSW